MFGLIYIKEKLHNTCVYKMLIYLQQTVSSGPFWEMGQIISGKMGDFTLQFISLRKENFDLFFISEYSFNINKNNLKLFTDNSNMWKFGFLAIDSKPDL